MDKSGSKYYLLLVLRWILGALLLTAAALKGYAMATGPLIDMGLWASLIPPSG